MFFQVPAFVPAGQPIPFPLGTTTVTQKPAWALYANPALNRSWLAYATPAGTRITALGGVRNVRYYQGNIDAFVRQRQLAQCGGCD